MDKAAALLKKAQKDAKVCDTLSAAQAASAAGSSKCWAVLPLSSSSLSEVHAVLTDGSSNLGVVLVAAQGPVSQMEVLRAMEYGGVYVAAEAMEGQGATQVLAEAACFDSGPSLVLLAEANTIQADDQWTAFKYDPRRECQGLDPFCTESDRVREEIKGFLSRQNLLTLIAKKCLPKEPVAAGAEGDLS
jgi:pyruvate/2-oxoacid:ferredoxin oxidoreductase beta subunit